jgi:hypothetical protein
MAMLLLRNLGEKLQQIIYRQDKENEPQILDSDGDPTVTSYIFVVVRTTYIDQQAIS